MKIGIVEDNTVTRDTLELLLKSEPDVKGITTFGTAEELLSEMLRTQDCPFSLLLVDLDLPGMHGTELIQKIKQDYPAMEILVYTIFEDRETVFAAIKAGATGYILKSSPPRELLDSLKTVKNGGAPMSPKIARKVLQEFQKETVVEIDNPLSTKEIAIVRLIEQGLTYKEIAEQLRISPHTVHTHIKNSYEKLQAANRREALRRARKIGII